MTDVLPEQRYAASFHRQIEHVKRHVKCLGVADLLCGPAGRRTGLKRSGDRWVGLCPLPDHDEKTPSFTVYEEDERGWFCYGCSRGGDVLDLWMLANGHAEKWTALVELAHEYGVELVGRSERWHAATERKDEYRRAAYRVLGNVLMRRLFRVMVLPQVNAIEDPAERDAELKRAWAEWQDELFWPALAERMMR